MSRPGLTFACSMILAASVASLATGCSNSSKHSRTAAEERSEARSDKKTKAQAKAEIPVPPGAVSRTQLDQILRQGPPWLLSRVDMEEVLRKDKFVGWRLTQFPSEWDASGLKPGDIVTRVNGVGLEKPDDLWDAWVAVADSKDIRVDYERDGKTSEAVVPIAGEADPGLRKSLEDGSSPAPSAAKKGKLGLSKSTVIIGSDTGPDDTSD